MKLLECIPNVSEGRDPARIEAIAAAARSVQGAHLLHVDPGPSPNRTVLTIAGEPEPVLEAVRAVARSGYERIDMREQRGEHPRLGAVDVVPFVPLAGVSMDECVELARRFGRYVGDELGVPVYLYGEAQGAAHRRSVARIRRGEYEGLPEKLGDPAWAPDFGPARFNPRWGATMAGARRILIAYNVDLAGTAEQAQRLAARVRESGRLVEGAAGGRMRQPGTFRGVRAIGWELEERGVAQVSMNVEDFRAAPLAEVYEAIGRGAEEAGIEAVGSEIVGLVPLEAMLDAADYFLAREGRRVDGEREKVELAVDRLGLDRLRPFDPDEKILEYRLKAVGLHP